MAEIIPFPNNSREATLAPLEELGKSAHQEIRQCLHDIRSPLSVFQIAKEKLREESPVFAQAYERFEGILERMENTLTLQGQKEKSATKSSSFASVIQEVIEEKTYTRPHFSPRFLCLEQSASLPANVDAGELKRVLSNLLNNALEADEKGQITIVYKIQKGVHQIALRDRGQGLAASHLHELSQKPQSQKGMYRGLGLTHARNALAQWGGSLKISSAWGKGCQVTLQIPFSPLSLA